MTPTAIAVAAALLSFAVAWFACRFSYRGLIKQMEQELDAGQVQIDLLSEQKNTLQDELARQQTKFQEQLDAAKGLLHKETLRLTDQVNQHQVKAGRLEAMLISERKHEAERSRDFQELNNDLQAERTGRSQSDQRVKELETRLEEQQVQNQKALAMLNDNKESLKQEFKHLAHEIFEARGKVLSDQHHEQLHSLLAPFKEQLGEFRTKVEQAHQEDSAGRAALKQQLETLHQLNRKMTDDAENLAKALKGDKKLQGNWGEMQVETILDSSGLIKGQEYQREPNYRDEDGQNRRPDFIVHLPEGKHLIIDSKVSLVDYMAFVNAETDAERDAAMTRHIQSIRNHINSLSQKDYPSLPQIKAPDFVFMFMPIEPAFISAFQHDQQLFNDAFEKRIVVVTPTTLLATLRTVANLWTIERQNANTRKLAEKGRQVYDKLRVFVEKMEKLDVQLGNARTTYDDAMGTLKHGRGNLIAQADQFLALGVRVKKELPSKTLETADLEPLESDELLALEAGIDDSSETDAVDATFTQQDGDNAESENDATPATEDDSTVNEELPHGPLDLASLNARPSSSIDTASVKPGEVVDQPSTEALPALEDPDFSALESSLTELSGLSADEQLSTLEAELARLEREHPELAGYQQPPAGHPD